MSFWQITYSDSEGLYIAFLFDKKILDKSLREFEQSDIEQVLLRKRPKPESRNRNPNPQSRNRNPKPNPETDSRNPNPETRNRNPNPQTLNP